MKLHSTVGLITNSSTELYLRATGNTVKGIKALIKFLGLDPNDYEVSIQRTFGEYYLQDIMKDEGLTRVQAIAYLLEDEESIGDDYIVVRKGEKTIELKDLFEAMEV